MITYKPLIFIISGKDPLTISSGYASYAKNLGKILTDLHYDVQIFSVGKLQRRIKTSFGTVTILKNPLFFFSIIQKMAMIAFPIFCFQIALKIKKNTKKPAIIWGIGPWSLTGVFLKLFSGKHIILADYFTTIRHEFSGRLRGMPMEDYGIVPWIINKIAQFSLIPFYSVLEKFLLTKVDTTITHYISIEHILTSEFSLTYQKFIRLPYIIGLKNIKISFHV